MTYANGEIPSSALVDLSTPGSLLASAAASFERLRKDAKSDGFNMGTSNVDHAYRSVARQAVLLYQNYDNTYRPGCTYNNGKLKFYKGKYWYKKPSAAVASTPGQSNHGYGIAVDFQGLGGWAGYNGPSEGKGYQWMRLHAGAHGWNNVQGKSLGEPWHWVYVEANDKHRNDKPDTPPTPSTKDDDMKLKATSTTQHQALKKGTWKNLRVDDGSLVSLLTGEHNPIIAQVQFTVTDLPEGAVPQARFVVYSDAEGKVTRRFPIGELVRTSGGTYTSLMQLGQIGKGERLRVQITGPDGATVTSVQARTVTN